MKCILQGHIDLDRVIKSGLIDFIMAPAHYGVERDMGGASGFLLPVDSLACNNIEYVHEIDHRTATCNFDLSSHVTLPSNYWPDEESTIAGLKREFCIAFLRNASLWWFDMWGHFYDGVKVKEAIGKMRAFWQKNRDEIGGSAADVAVFVDETGWLRCNPYDASLAGYSRGLMESIGHTGAEVAYYSFADIGNLDLSRFKLIILPNLFATTKATLQLLREKVLRDERTVLWFARPGVIHEDVYNEAQVETLCGIPFGKKGIVTREMDGWTSVLSPAPLLERSALRNIAAKAGVHQYVETEDPVWASGNFLCLHVKEGGRREIRLPRKAGKVVECFSGRAVAENTEHFEDTLATPDTVLYRICP